MLIAYTKNANVAEILTSDLPGGPGVRRRISSTTSRCPCASDSARTILNHRLRREIATTKLVNQMANLSGISYDHRMTEDTGASITDVSRAWVAVREVLDFPVWWEEIGDLTDIALDDQLELYLDCRRAAERCSLWILRHRRPPVSIALEVDRFRGPVQELDDWPRRLPARCVARGCRRDDRTADRARCT